MSCIDAAIIRALVEHIGMNPDEIPTGGVNNNTSPFQDIKWEDISKGTYFKFDTSNPETVRIKPLQDKSQPVCGRLVEKSGDITSFVFFPAIEGQATSSRGFIYCVMPEGILMTDLQKDGNDYILRYFPTSDFEFSDTAPLTSVLGDTLSTSFKDSTVREAVAAYIIFYLFG